MRADRPVDGVLDDRVPGLRGRGLGVAPVRDDGTSRDSCASARRSTLLGVTPESRDPGLWVGIARQVGTFEPMGAAAAIRAGVRADVVRIVDRGFDLPEVVRRSERTLHRAVPFDGICLLTVDLVTLLPTGEIVENGLPPSAWMRMTEIEIGEPDFNEFTDLARAAVPAASRSAATGGRLDRSRRDRVGAPPQRLRRRA